MRRDRAKDLAELFHLSLGSNLGDRSANLRSAIDRLGEAGVLKAVSSLYETEPVDVREQPWFLNCAVALETDRSPSALLARILAIEETIGRLRVPGKGPRMIDIDILLAGDRVVNEPGLKIPHPAMAQRRFVLEPLVEIAANTLHPVLRKTAGELLAALPPGQSVRKI